MPSATAAEAPPLTAADLDDYRTCATAQDTPGCEEVAATFQAGTGCLQACQQSFQEYVALSQEYCAGVPEAECGSVTVPCGGTTGGVDADDQPGSPSPPAGNEAQPALADALADAETAPMSAPCSLL